MVAAQVVVQDGDDRVDVGRVGAQRHQHVHVGPAPNKAIHFTLSNARERTLSPANTIKQHYATFKEPFWQDRHAGACARMTYKSQACFMQGRSCLQMYTHSHPHTYDEQSRSVQTTKETLSMLGMYTLKNLIRKGTAMYIEPSCGACAIHAV